MNDRLGQWFLKMIVLTATAGAIAILALTTGSPKASGAQAGSSVKAPSDLIRVATYNVRGPSDRSPNAWKDRLPRMLRTIRENRFDLIGTQETLPRAIGDLTSGLGFESFGVGRDRKKADEHNVVLYDPERFSVVSQETFWLSPEPEMAGSSGWDSSLPRICTWGVLQDRKTGKKFVIANTHLDHQSAVARMQGINVILQRLGSMIEKYPFILTGDFNSTGDDAPARMLRNVLRDSRDVSETDHYGAGDETFHNFKENRRERSHRKPIDFIFVNNRVRVLSHGTIQDFRDGLASSDHFPVTAEVVLLDEPLQQ